MDKQKTRRRKRNTSAGAQQRRVMLLLCVCACGAGVSWLATVGVGVRQHIAAGADADDPRQLGGQEPAGESENGGGRERERAGVSDHIGCPFVGMQHSAAPWRREIGARNQPSPAPQARRPLYT